jgi:hypothetical protein
MTIRMPGAVAVTTAVLVAGTACASSPGQEAALPTDLDPWIADTLPAPAEGGFSIAGNTSSDDGGSTGTTPDVEPGWYAVTMACTLTGSEAGSQAHAPQLTLSGEHGVYGEGDCPASPVTTTTYLGASAESPPEMIAVKVEADAGEHFWGVSASPTTAPQQ